MSEYKPDWGKSDRVQRMIRTYPERYTDNFWKTLNHYFSEKDNIDFLEIGCGPGLFLADVKKRYSGVSTTGLDEQENMLEEAKKRNPDSNFIRAPLDIDFIHYHGKRYDIIFVGFLFHEIAEPLVVFESVGDRLLVGNGKLVIYDFIFSPIKDYIEHGPFKGTDLTESIRRFPKPAKYSLDDISYLLERAGYKTLQKKRVTPVAGLVIATV
ncbi:MAG: class I SAM-dependent methyltransferase [Candidatus Odinarchaeota archaeon]